MVLDAPLFLAWPNFLPIRADRNPSRKVEGGGGFQDAQDLEQVFPRMTFYCLRNDRGRISMDFGPLQTRPRSNDTSEASNRFHASSLLSPSNVLRRPATARSNHDSAYFRRPAPTRTSRLNHA